MNDEETRPAGQVGAEVGVGRPDAELALAFEDEALRVVGSGRERGVVLRIIGALAFHHHCPEFGYIQAKLNRVYTDIDFAAYAKASATSVRRACSSRSAVTLQLCEPRNVGIVHG